MVILERWWLEDLWSTCEVEFQGGRHNGMYAFASWGRVRSAWGGVEHTGNSTTMKDLGCYALVVSKKILHKNRRHSGGWGMYSTTLGITRKVQAWLDARIFEKAEDIPMAEDVWCILVELPKIPSVVWMQGSSTRRKAFRWLKRLRCRLVELPKISSVIGFKNLQEGGRHSDGWRG